jgi:hypothetical protein
VFFALVKMEGKCYQLVLCHNHLTDLLVAKITLSHRDGRFKKNKCVIKSIIINQRLWIQNGKSTLNYFYHFQCLVCKHHRPNNWGGMFKPILYKSLCFSLFTNWNSHFTTMCLLLAGRNSRQGPKLPTGRTQL